MSQFKKNLESIPSVEHLSALEVRSRSGSEVVVSIENKPGKSGSLAVYSYLNSEFGAMTPAAAQRGLDLFAEYTEEAKLRPGSHPNIDFLFEVVEKGAEYKIVELEK